MCCIDGMCDSCIALSLLREKLNSPPPHNEGFGEVTFLRTDGRTVVLDNVDFDGIGPDSGTHGVVSATLEDGTIVHLPFVESWTVDFRI